MVASKKLLDDACKALLFLDNCSDHPPDEILIKNNVYYRNFTPSMILLTQSCNEVILRLMKSQYKNTFLNSILTAMNRGICVIFKRDIA